MLEISGQQMKFHKILQYHLWLMSTWLNQSGSALKSRKHSAARVRDADFERAPPLLLLCRNTVILNYFSNHRFL